MLRFSGSMREIFFRGILSPLGRGEGDGAVCALKIPGLAALEHENARIILLSKTLDTVREWAYSANSWKVPVSNV
jgi:hypothetical protein